MLSSFIRVVKVKHVRLDVQKSMLDVLIGIFFAAPLRIQQVTNTVASLLWSKYLHSENKLPSLKQNWISEEDFHDCERDDVEDFSGLNFPICGLWTISSITRDESRNAKWIDDILHVSVASRYLVIAAKS